MIGKVRARLFMALHSLVKTSNNNIQEKIINFTVENNLWETFEIYEEGCGAEWFILFQFWLYVVCSL